MYIYISVVTGIPANMNGSLSSLLMLYTVTVQVYTPPVFGL